MALLNPGFEDAGSLPGEAAHWNLTAVTSLQRLAGFGTAPQQAWEDFERWFEPLAALDDVTVVLALFDGAMKGYEAFESGWANAVYLVDFPPSQLVAASFDGHTIEDCETGWSNVPFARDWADLANVACVFQASPHEDFETQWSGNQQYAWTWAGVASAAAMFNGGGQPVEDFNNAWTTMTTL